MQEWKIGREEEEEEAKLWWFECFPITLFIGKKSYEFSLLLVGIFLCLDVDESTKAKQRENIFTRFYWNL